MTNILFNKTLQDGKLTPTSGRIVIYQNCIDISRGNSRDHNDLLRSLASKYRLDKDQVISNAIRLYWDYLYTNATDKTILVCPVRKIDEDMFYAKQDFYENLISGNL
jgi:hypothetical protein